MWLLRPLSVLAAAMPAVCTPVSIPGGPLHGGYPSRHLVTGVGWRDDQGHVPVRREIRDLKKNFPDQWSLYLLGLRAFHNSNQTDPLSFYQIAGIHGRPYKVWQDAQGIPGKTGGYCPHQNPLFLGWHRPYVALYEQELYKYVRDIALRSPPQFRERFASAADSFRIPYWDWALGDNGGSIPDFFMTPMIQIVGPDLLNQTISNPLYRYDFHPLIPGDFMDQWATHNHTLRWPTSTLPVAESQNQKFVADYDSSRNQFHDTVSNGFSIAANLNDFSIAYIENAHGWVHYSIGGPKPGNGGHMWPVEYSAFEPLFMLVHGNVDRLFALWQAVHPDKWFNPSSVGTHSNFVLNDNQVVDGNTPLSPFWMTAETFWTANDARNTAVLGYAYPETQIWDFASEDAYRLSVNATIARLYSNSVRDRLTTSSSGQSGDLRHLNVNKSFTDWNINTSASSTTLNSSFQVRFTLVGDFSSDPVLDVGIWTVLMPPRYGNEQIKSKEQRPVSSFEREFKGSVSLTASLLDCVAAGILESLEIADVVPFLKAKLTWMVYSDGGLVSNSVLQDLSVDVTSAKVHIPDDFNQPLDYSEDFVVHPDITTRSSFSAKY